MSVGLQELRGLNFALRHSISGLGDSRAGQVGLGFGFWVSGFGFRGSGLDLGFDSCGAA